MKEYRYIGKDGMPTLARDLEDQRDAALAKLAEVEDKLKHAKLNMPHPDQMIDDTLVEIEGEEE